MTTLIARAWLPAIRNMLRPSELVNAVVSCVRLAAKPLAGLIYLGSDVSPTAYGVQADCVSLTLSEIQRSSDNPDYPWSMRGLPEGIVRFGKCLSGDAALLGADFIYEKRAYCFRSTPAQYATISEAGGVPTATFSVTYGNRKHTAYEDVFNRYDGATDSNVLRAAALHDQYALSSNGLSGYAVTAACGVRPASGTVQIKAQWTEGDKFFAATTSGELIVDVARNPKLHIGATVTADTSLSKAVNSSMVISLLYDPAERKSVYYWLPEGVSAPSIGFPEQYRTSPLMESRRLGALSAYPIRVYDTTRGPTDSGSNKTLGRRITTAADVILAQQLSVTLSNPEIKNKVTRVLLHLGTTATEPETRLKQGNCTPRYATSTYNCLEIPSVCNTGDTIYAISANGVDHSSLFSPGNYILGVGLASSYDDAILGYESIEPVVIKAGACVALEIN